MSLTNSGIGLSIGERLIDEFLATRSLNSHLVLVPTTRSEAKSTNTIHSLRTYADRAAQTSAVLRSRAGGDEDFHWEDHAGRVHILSVQLDLCDIRGIYEIADRVCNGTLSNPSGVEGPDGDLQDVVIPRFDSILFNAAFGGWSGLNYFTFFWSLITQGFIEAVTWPKCKIASPTRILNQQPAYRYVRFCAPRRAPPFSVSVPIDYEGER